MIKSEDIKSMALSLGADRCGIAGIERFSDAPPGFHPADIWPGCRSVAVFLKRMPAAILSAENPVPYTNSAHVIYSMLDEIGVNLCSLLESKNIPAIPVPTDDPYLYWDQENMRGMGILSLRHAGRNAGLGFLGRNTLLINPELGNLVYIGAVLIDADLEADPMRDDLVCPSSCKICLDACPVNALDGTTVNQKRCRKMSFVKHERGWYIYKCNDCRKACPWRAGINYSFQQPIS